MASWEAVIALSIALTTLCGGLPPRPGHAWEPLAVCACGVASLVALRIAYARGWGLWCALALTQATLLWAMLLPDHDPKLYLAGGAVTLACFSGTCWRQSTASWSPPVASLWLEL